MDFTNRNFVDLNDLLGGLFGYEPHRSFIPHAKPQTEPQHNANTAFSLAEQIKQKREQIAREQAALEEAEKQYQEQLNKIRYIADDEKIEMLIPREKMIKLIKGLTDAINNNKDAKSYKVTITL
jgi:regulator of protease activity HflC (stomatin/prohibitin superfamily)